VVELSEFVFCKAKHRSESTQERGLILRIQKYTDRGRIDDDECLYNNNIFIELNSKVTLKYCMTLGGRSLEK